MPQPKKFFFSYSKADREDLVRLQKHLSPLRNNDKLTTWDDADIIPGELWDKRIKEELDTAEIILLLVSVDFLATPYIQDVELPQAKKRHDAKEAIVIPIILRPCDWKEDSFLRELNALPWKAKPISSYTDKDEAWVEVVNGIKKVLGGSKSSLKNDTDTTSSEGDEEKTVAENALTVSGNNNIVVKNVNNSTINISTSPPKNEPKIVQNAEKIYNIEHIDNADFS